MEYERIYHGIHLASIERLCSPETLKMNGFTHIIENNTFSTQVNIKQMCSNKSPNLSDGMSTHMPMMKTSHTYLDSNILFSGTNITIPLNISELSNNGCSTFIQDKAIDKEFSPVQPTFCRHVYITEVISTY